MLQSSKKFSLSLRQSFINQHWKKREGDCRTASFVLATIVGSKNKNIHLRDFKDVDFNFTHFANFKFAYFEIEESFGLIWVKLQNGRFYLQIFILGTSKVLVSSKCFIFTHFVNNRYFGQIWIKIIEWPIKVENCHFRTCFANYGVLFCI